MIAASSAAFVPYNVSRPHSPQFGNAWQRLMASVSRGGQYLGSSIRNLRKNTLVEDTFQSLQYSKDFRLHIGEVFPAVLTSSVLLYLLGQEQRQLDDPKAPLRLLAESASIYALTTYTSYVIPVLGLMGISYTAGKQETLVDKIKHSGVAALGTVGSLLGAWAGIGFNMDKTQEDVSKTLELLPESRTYLSQHAPQLVKQWQPETIPDTLKTPKDIAAYKATQRQKILQHLKDFETKLAQGHEATLKAYKAKVSGGSIADRVHLRQQLSTVFSELWNHLHPAQEALSHGNETPALKQTLQLVRRLETINTSYVKAARWANPILFGVLGSLAFQLLTPFWEHLCDTLFSGRLGHSSFELSSHTLLNHGGEEGHTASHSNLLWQQHQRFNAFAKDPFSGNTHTETLNTYAARDILNKAIHGPH